MIKDYKYLYFKYKKKYLEKKKLLGGNIPGINEKILPILNINANYYMNKNVILKSNISDISYNFNTDNFNFEEIESGDNSNISYNILYKYADHMIRVDSSNVIPFSLVLLENNFNILSKFYRFCTEYVLENKDEFNFTENNISLIDKIFKKYFVFHRNTKEFISLSVKPNILNNFLFIGKYKEILQIIYSEESDEQFYRRKISEIFRNQQNFINFYDTHHAYRKITNSDDDIETSIAKLNKYISKNVNSFNTYFKMFKIEIEELRKFNKYLDIIDRFNLVGETTPLKTKLSYLFYATYLGLRLKKPSLSSKGNNNFYPINIKTSIKNVLGESYVEPDSILVDSSNINLFKTNNNFPNLESYSSSKYTFEEIDYVFPDCVENTLYQLFKALTWTGNRYETSYLPATSKEQLIDIFTRLRPETNLKHEFINIVTNIPNLPEIYKKEKNGVKYEIASTPENFTKILSYLIGANIEEDINILKINPNIINISFENETFEINFGLIGKFLATVKPGHTSHIIVTDLLEYLKTFDYINIIIIFSQLYPLFSILRVNILTRFIQINKNSSDILNRINKIILIEEQYCDTVLELNRLRDNKKELKNIYSKDSEEYAIHRNKIDETKRDLKKINKKLLDKKRRNIKKITETFRIEDQIIPISKFLLLDERIYSIDSPNNCDLFYDLNDLIIENINIFLYIINKFNKTEREYILINTKILINGYGYGHGSLKLVDYIKVLNLLDLSLFTEKLINSGESNENISILLYFFYDKGTNNYYFGSVIKSIMDRFTDEYKNLQIDILKAEIFNGKTGKQIIEEKLGKITDEPLKSYIIETFKMSL